MQSLEVSGAVRPKCGTLGFKRLRSSSSFLRLLPRLPVTSIPSFTFPSITHYRRQFLLKKRTHIFSKIQKQFVFCLSLDFTASWYLGCCASSSGNPLPTFRDIFEAQESNKKAGDGSTRCRTRTPYPVSYNSAATSDYKISYWGYRLSSMDSWPSKIGPIGCPEMSVKNCYYSLRNNPEERSSNLLRGGSLKLLTVTCSVVSVFRSTGSRRNLNALPVQLKVLLPGLEGCVFSRGI
jgi:hypothetical protein